jgi:hypothetical protein
MIHLCINISDKQTIQILTKNQKIKIQKTQSASLEKLKETIQKLKLPKPKKNKTIQIPKTKTHFSKQMCGPQDQNF